MNVIQNKKNILKRLSPKLLPCVLIISLVVCTLGYKANAAEPKSTSNEINASPPSDLLLSDKDIRKAKAFSYYAWSLFLRYEIGKRREETVEYLVKALENAPEWDALARQLVVPWLRRGEYEKIIRHMKPVSEKAPEATMLQLAISSAYERLGKDEEAMVYLGDVWKKTEVRSPVLLRSLVSLLLEHDKYEKARQALAEARETDPLKGGYIIAYLSARYYGALAATMKEGKATQTNSGTDTSQTNLKKKAVDYALKASDLFHKTQKIEDVSRLVNMLAKLEKNEQIQDIFKRAEEGFPSKSRYIEFQKADFFNRRGNSDKALTILDRINDDPPENLEGNLQIGKRYLSMKKYTRAAEVYRRCLQYRPFSMELRITLANLELSLGNPEKAIDLFKKFSSEKIPIEGKILLGHAHAATDNYEKAFEWLNTIDLPSMEKIRARKNVDIEFFLFYATVSDKLDKFDKTCNILDKALTLDPENPMAANFKGYLLADHDTNLKEAEKLIKTALKKAPTRAAFLDSMAWVYFRQEKFEFALEEINKALTNLDKNRGEPTILDHAGDIYKANGYRLMAARYWHQALQHSPENPEKIQTKLSDILSAEKERDVLTQYTLSSTQ